MTEHPSLGSADWDVGNSASKAAAAPDPPAKKDGDEDDDVNVASLLPKRRERDEEAQAPPAPASEAPLQPETAEAQDKLGNVEWDKSAPVQQGLEKEDVMASSAQEATVAEGHAPAQEHAGLEEEGEPGLKKPAARPPPKKAFEVPTSGAFWQHDDRLDESEILDMEKARQEAKRKKKEAMSKEGRWQHDKFAVMDEEEPVVDYGPPRRGRGGRGRGRGRGGYSKDENGSLEGRSGEHSYDGGGRGRGRGRGQGSPTGQRPAVGMPGMKAPGWQLQEREPAAAAEDGGFPLLPSQQTAVNGDLGGQHGRGSGRRSPSGRGGRGQGRSSFGGGSLGGVLPTPGAASQVPGSRRYTVMAAARGGGVSAGAQGGRGGFGDEDDSGWNVAPSAGAGGWDVSPSAGAGGWEAGAASAPAAAPPASATSAAAATPAAAPAAVPVPNAHGGGVSLGEADWDAEPGAAQGGPAAPPAEVASLTAQLKAMAAPGGGGSGAAPPAAVAQLKAQASQQGPPPRQKVAAATTAAASGKEDPPMDLNAWMSQAMRAAMEQGQTEEQAYATVQAYVAQQTQQYAEQQLQQQ